MESKPRFEDASNWQRRETPNSKNRWRSLCFHEHVLRTLLTICPSPPLSPTFYSRPLDPVAVFHEYQMTSHPPPRPRQESTVFCFRAMRGTSYAHCSAFMSRRMTERGFVNREWKMAVYPRSEPRSGVTGGDIWES